MALRLNVATPTVNASTQGIISLIVLTPSLQYNYRVTELEVMRVPNGEGWGLQLLQFLQLARLPAGQPPLSLACNVSQTVNTLVSSVLSDDQRETVFAVLLEKMF
jgi:hypothetical protein